MLKIKARKVYTPGSVPARSPRGQKGKENDDPAKDRLNRTRGQKKKAKDRLKGKTKRNYMSSYVKEEMLKAIQAVQDGEMGVRAASVLFSVPRSTLCDRIKGVTRTRPGRPTVLSAEEENLFVVRLILMGKWGFPLSKLDLCHLIQEHKLNIYTDHYLNVK